MRDIYGLKLTEEFVEMEIYGIKVTAHVKALPAPRTSGDHPTWSVTALSKEGHNLDVFALDSKGKEHQIKALTNGGSDQMLNIKAVIRAARGRMGAAWR